MALKIEDKMEILDILDEYRIPYLTEGNKHCRVGWIQLDCPFCGKDSNKFHLGYSLSGGYANCWKCGPHSLPSILVEYLGISFDKAKKLTKDLDTKAIKKEVRKKGKLILPRNIGDLQKAHIKYLKGRGFDNIEELKQLWKIQGIGIGTKLQWRIFIPIFYKNEMASWTTRSISDNVEARYIHASSEEEVYERNEILYGQDYARHSVILCEGPTDVWKIGPGAVASLGLSYSQKQIVKLIQYPIRAVCFDNEPVAQRRAEALVDLLSIYPGETYNIQLDSKDPGSATEKEIKRIRRLLR